MEVATAQVDGLNQSCVESQPSAPKRTRRDVKCEQCNVNDSKYTCPKCNFRSCSVDCVKKHKESKSCDGIPNSWQKVQTYSKFTPEVSINDQKFFEQINHKLDSFDKNDPNKESKSANKLMPPKQFHQNDSTDRLPRKEFLLQKSAAFRRICLKIDENNKTEDSHHENFSDTIFWSIRMRFVRSNSTIVPSSTKSLGLTQLAAYDSSSDNNSSTDSPTKTLKNVESEEFSVDTTKVPKSTELEECFSYLARDIPETVTVRTFLKQFVEPKMHGPIVSKSDLDLDKMASFFNALNSCLVYMPVKINEVIKYFPINQSQSILDNLRNKTVNGHPEFVVALETYAFDFEQPTQTELQSIRPAFHQQFNKNPNGFNNNRKRPQNRPNQRGDNTRNGTEPNRPHQNYRPNRGGRRF